MLMRLSISRNRGRSAPAGKDCMRLTADSMSSRARAMSVSKSIWTRTEAMPGAATDLTAFTSSSPLTWSSILTTIDSSISSGVAPG